jgi:hypothetical protein
MLHLRNEKKAMHGEPCFPEDRPTINKNNRLRHSAIWYHRLETMKEEAAQK